MSSDPVVAEVLRAVNNLRETIEKNNEQVNKTLKQHMDDEENELAIFRKFNDERAKMIDVRHNELLQVINTINMVDALPKIDGKPDIHGHRLDHESRMKAAQERRDFLVELVKGGIKTGTGAFLVWAAYNLWQAFLMGPK